MDCSSEASAETPFPDTPVAIPPTSGPIFDEFLLQTARAQASVLVVEDDFIQRITARKHITDLGHVSTEVSTGEEAVQMICRQYFDIVLMDVFLPDINGVELCQLLHSQACGETPVVIALSASEDIALIQRCMATGFCRDYVVKPLRPTEMRLRIENALIEKQLNRTEAARVKALDECVSRLERQGVAMVGAARMLGAPGQAVAAEMTQSLLALESSIGTVTPEQRLLLDHLHKAKDAVTVLGAHSEIINGTIVSGAKHCHRYNK